MKPAPVSAPSGKLEDRDPLSSSSSVSLLPSCSLCLHKAYNITK